MNYITKHVYPINKSYFETKSILFKILVLIFLATVLSGCGSFNQDNIYGNGHYVSQEELDANSLAQPDTTDYQANQYQFVSISVKQVSYNLTQTLSQISVQGSCFNPGFQFHSIYFNAVDASGSSMAPDGMLYSSNIDYYPGTTQLKPSSIYCSSNGQWSTVINVPTAILYKLAQGYLDISMVVWYKGNEYHNNTTGMASVAIDPPPLEDLFSADNGVPQF